MEYDLIKTIVACVVSALVFGLLAKKLNMPTIFGYLVAGVAIGPYTPGVVADIAIARQLAEIGIILLMFGVGMHFSFKDLGVVRKIALPGALFQIISATAIGAVTAKWAGFDWVAGVMFGFALSVASTVVLLRALDRRGISDSEIGKIAIGWLIIEDLAMIFAIVLLPLAADILADSQAVDIGMIGVEIAKVALKVSAFTILMIVVGRRLLPWLLAYVAKTKSHELLSLTTLAVALSFAYLAYRGFGTSFALGAFLAGMVLNESKAGQKSVEHSLPMRDTFAVLFFVSVGMLFNPATLLDHPWLLLATLAVIVIGKFIAAFVIMALFRQSRSDSVAIGVSLAQIGEFSFIFAGMAVVEGLMPDTLYSVILAAALLSIALNHFLFRILSTMGLLPRASAG